MVHRKKAPLPRHAQQGDLIKGEDKYFFFLW